MSTRDSDSLNAITEVTVELQLSQRKVVGKLNVEEK